MGIGILKSISALAGSNLLGSILAAIGGVLVARYVDPTENGEFRVFGIPLMYLSFLHLGTLDGISRQIPFFSAKGDIAYVEKIAAASGAWNAFIASVVAAGFVVLEIFALWSGDTKAGMGWLTQSIVCFAIFYGGYISATYRTLHGFVGLARIQLIQTVIGFIFVAAVISWGFYGLCLRAAVPGLLGIFLFHKSRPLKVKLEFDRGALWDVMKVGLPLCLWSSIYNPLWIAAESTLIHEFGGATALGYFAVAIIVKESVCIIPQAFNQVFMPRIVESFSKAGSISTGIRQTILSTALLVPSMAAVAGIASVALSFAVPKIIPMYTNGLPIMQALLLHGVLQAASLPLNSLVANGRIWLYGRGVLVGVFVFGTSVYLLEPIIGGVMAVAYGSIIGRSARISAGYFELYKLMRNK